MLEKAKEFYKKNKKVILVVGGVLVIAGVGYIITKKIVKPTVEVIEGLKYDFEADKKILEGFGAVYTEGSDVPSATKEVAQNFMEKMGSNYQIDIMDKDTAVVWISK